MALVFVISLMAIVFYYVTAAILEQVSKEYGKNSWEVKMLDIEEKRKMNNDIINHPSHYTDGKFETIEAIESWRLGYHLGNAVKYISRAGKKSKDTELEDLRKARWYIKRYLDYHPFPPKSIGAMEYAADKGLDQDLTLALICLAAPPPLSDNSEDIFVSQALVALERAIGVREARANE